jgi:dTDP-4-dehydrorhamnose 3,5-epimerase-like enzyme
MASERMGVKIVRLQDDPQSKLIEDPRGLMAQVENGREFKHLLVLESKKNSVRGNHYHEKKQEWFYLASGKCRFAFENVKTRERFEEVLSPGEKVFIPPHIAHAILALEDSVLVEYSMQVFNPETPDTFKAELL